MYKYLDEVRIHISAKFIDKFSSIVLHFLKYIRMLVGLKMKNASITISVCVQFLVSSSIFVIDTLLEEAWSRKRLLSDAVQRNDWLLMID